MEPLTLAFITDLHFGPRAFFEGKLRKLTHEAGSLAEAVIKTLNDEVKPDLLINLGDDIEDESHEADLRRYRECQEILRKANAKLINVAGNHDTIFLGIDDLSEIWGRRGPLHYSFEERGWRFIVLHTVERKDVDVRIVPEQLEWLREELASSTLPVIVFMHHPASEQDLDDARWFAKAPHLALVQNRAELRSILEQSGKVRAVFNGHVHRNHFDVIQGIPYVTVQSLIENLDDDAPGRPASTYAIAKLSRERLVVRVRGNDPARYQLDFPR
ncbi:MAG: metallophosphoesterase [Polyangiaceae bacterium]